MDLGELAKIPKFIGTKYSGGIKRGGANGVDTG